jgi:hypothetical protein
MIDDRLGLMARGHAIADMRRLLARLLRQKYAPTVA